ncbi:MAG: thermonuclease family protein [Longimicrobiales bacterium]
MTSTRVRGPLAWIALAVVPAACGGQEGPAAPVRATTECTITRIVDGDTLICEPVGRVRLVGIDTPERAQEPFGDRATEALEAMIPEGGVVQLEPDAEDRDQFDRALRYVWVEGRMLNWVLVRAGYAVLLTYPPNVQYVDLLRAAQSAAQDEGAGLWAVDGFACPPQEYRRGDCR